MNNMIKLARIFCDYMVLQRDKPVCIWGESECDQTIDIKISGKKIYTAQLSKGNFTLLLPKHPAAEDVKLEIGTCVFEHVDFGEVWVAGGQSNMEFKLLYDQNGDSEIASADDSHIRMYTVGQYSFEGVREAGYKAWNPWEEWLPFKPDYAADMSAVGVYFAKKIRENGIPVGIISCNWGGTSASAWTEKKYLSEDSKLVSYIKDFNEIVSKLDLERYYAVKNAIRPGMESRQSKEASAFLMKKTFHPEELMKKIGLLMSEPEVSEKGSGMLELGKLSIEEIIAVGPGDPQEPGVLYEHMLREIIGYTVQGILWYQGENDVDKADIYGRLFATMITCWRNTWKKKNTALGKLPFFYVQLAPLGVWREANGDRFLTIREQQEIVAKEVEDTYMACISDAGNVYDIHPKDKHPVGERLALLAQKFLYGKSLEAEAPEAVSLVKHQNSVSIYFKNSSGLYKKEKKFDSYNGFSTDEIYPILLPPILDGINGLQVFADSRVITDAQCCIEGDRLEITAIEIETAGDIRVLFAQTGFYEVNLYNGAEIPVKPFTLVWNSKTNTF